MEDTYDKNCGLTRFEWQCENIIDEILKEESTLLRIGILKRFVEAHMDCSNEIQRAYELGMEHAKQKEKEYLVCESCNKNNWDDPEFWGCPRGNGMDCEVEIKKQK